MPTSQETHSTVGDVFSTTEYQARYIKHKYQYTPLHMPPRHIVMIKDPCSNRTESRDQYTEKSIPVRFLRVQQPYVQNPNKLESVSGYQQDYPKWPLTYQQQKNLLIKPVSQTSSHKQAFEGISTHQQDYQKWAIPKRYVHVKAHYEPNQSPLERESCYTLDFCNKSKMKSTSNKNKNNKKTQQVGGGGGQEDAQPFQRRVSCKPVHVLIPNRPFVGVSEYTHSYHH